MYPNLLDLGFLHLRTYGACMAIGFILCWTLIERLSRRKDLSNLLVALMFAGVVGSRIAYVIEHWEREFAANPLAVIRVDQGGLMFYGGLILAIAVFFIWCAMKREHPLALGDLLLTVLPLGHACGRLGCFFYGCCYGRRSDSFWAVAFPHHSPAWYDQFHSGLVSASSPRSLPVLPTQLYEALSLIVLFAVLVFVYRRYAATRRGLVIGCYLVGYAVIRFTIEGLRGDPRWSWMGLSISRLISLGLLAAGAAMLAAVLTLGRRKGNS